MGIASSEWMRGFAFATAMAWTSGCDAVERTSPLCLQEGLSVLPSSATLRPEERFTFQVGGRLPLARCDGSVVPAPSWRWTSSRPLVATIDSLTGVVTARDTGQTLVVVRTVEDRKSVV